MRDPRRQPSAWLSTVPTQARSPHSSLRPQGLKSALSEEVVDGVDGELRVWKT